MTQNKTPPLDSPMQLLVNALRDPRWATESTEMARDIANRARKDVDAYLADPQAPAAPDERLRHTDAAIVGPDGVGNGTGANPLQTAALDERLRGRTIQDVFRLHLRSYELMLETYQRVGDSIATTEGQIEAMKRAIEVADNFADHEAQQADRIAELRTATIEYLDNQPDGEQGTGAEWRKFYPMARRLEKLLGVGEGRWG